MLKHSQSLLFCFLLISILLFRHCNCIFYNSHMRNKCLYSTIRTSYIHHANNLLICLILFFFLDSILSLLPEWRHTLSSDELLKFLSCTLVSLGPHTALGAPHVAWTSAAQHSSSDAAEKNVWLCNYLI